MFSKVIFVYNVPINRPLIQQFYSLFYQKNVFMPLRCWQPRPEADLIQIWHKHRLKVDLIWRSDVKSSNDNFDNFAQISQSQMRLRTGLQGVSPPKNALSHRCTDIYLSVVYFVIHKIIMILWQNAVSNQQCAMSLPLKGKRYFYCEGAGPPVWPGLLDFVS